MMMMTEKKQRWETAVGVKGAPARLAGSQRPQPLPTSGPWKLLISPERTPRRPSPQAAPLWGELQSPEGREGRCRRRSSTRARRRERHHGSCSSAPRTQARRRWCGRARSSRAPAGLAVAGACRALFLVGVSCGRPFELTLTTPGSSGRLRRVLRGPLRGGAGRPPHP